MIPNAHGVAADGGDCYDCVDRIVLNAYFGMGHSPGGVWWRALTGSDEKPWTMLF
jgi:hypothetical protein